MVVVTANVLDICWRQQKYQSNILFAPLCAKKSGENGVVAWHM